MTRRIREAQAIWEALWKLISLPLTRTQAAEIVGVGDHYVSDAKRIQK